jgi:hypothetical protein
MKPLKHPMMILACVLPLVFSGCRNGMEIREGLIGIYFSEPNLTSIKALSNLTSLDQIWGQDYEYGTESSGRWKGFLIGPADGKVGILLETNRRARLSLGGLGEIEAGGATPSRVLEAEMKRGEHYPVELIFWNDAGEGVFYPAAHLPRQLSAKDAFFSVRWSWDGQALEPVPKAALFHTGVQAAPLSHIMEPDPADIDMKQFLRVEARHVIVYHEEGRFGGWPANNGIWSWGDEILVGLTKGYFKSKMHHHSYDKSKPGMSVLARSLDGGASWTVEDPENYVGDGGKPSVLKRSIDFSLPGFALRNERDLFFFSTDRGRSWKGPYRYPEMNAGPLTSRTDYLTQGKNDCLFFLSCKSESVRATLQDRAFCARTKDGGRTIEFVGWMTDTDTVRSVMPATVRVSDSHLVSAMRRRFDPPITETPVLTRNWIDVYESPDNGKTWRFLSKIANTDTGLRNGNPPSMVRLDNGRLCVMYGYRGVPYTIRARVSDDNGKTWSREIILRDGARNWDIGYTRSVVRPDQKVVTVYYFTSDDPFENHIAATIWDPMDVEEI